MRISDFLRASFVGALLFTPAMADEVEQVHEEALRVLREQLGQANSAAPSSRLDQADPHAAAQRAEREARLKAEAQQRMAEREQLQAGRRQQFEQFVKDRERLRREQRAYDLNAAHQTGLVRESDYNSVHARALDALHQAQKQEANPVGASPAAFVADPTPVLVAQAPSSTPSALAASTQVDSADVHAKALEVLHQQLQSGQGLTTSTTVVGSTNDLPKPSPELQRRLKEMQAELEQEQLQKRSGAPAPSFPEGYVADLERRAREGSSAATTIAAPYQAPAPAPSGLDPATRNIIERQNREIARGLGNTAPATPQATPAAPAPVVTTIPAAVPTATVSHTTASDAANVQYSKELEDRARQILLERASQGVETTIAPATTSVTTTSPPIVTSTTSPAITVSSPTVQSTPPPAAINAATAAASNVSPSFVTTVESNAPRTKMQRLKELTDLYRADKMEPAEYHQKRAQILAEPQ